MKENVKSVKTAPGLKLTHSLYCLQRQQVLLLAVGGVVRPSEGQSIMKLCACWRYGGE